MTTSDDDELQLLASPLGSTAAHRAFVIGGPLGLLVAISIGLYVSGLHVEHTVNVQVETTWIPGETLAVRAQLMPEGGGTIEDVRGELWVEQHGQRFTLPRLEATPRAGLAHAHVVVPGLAEGPAAFHLRLAAEGVSPRLEMIPITVAPHRAARTPTPIVAGSSLQHGDDSDPQPMGVRIDVLPAGRWIGQFDNAVYVRVLWPDGRPYAGPVAVVLASGEFGGVSARLSQPRPLFRGRTNALGFVRIEGLLVSEVVRFEVQVLADDGAEEDRVLHRRRVRLVTFAGGVLVDAEPEVVATGTPAIAVTGRGFSRTRPVFVDVHATDGAWVASITPPFIGPEPPRELVLAAREEGLVQLEGYHFTNAPGESAAVRRIQVTDADPTTKASLAPLVALHEQAAALPRVDASYDAASERAYLQWLGRAELSPALVTTARRYLLATLPLAVYGPPAALMTRERDFAEVAALRRTWVIRLRIFVLGGGGLFLLLMVLSMRRALGRSASTTTAELQASGADPELLAHVARAQRQGVLRGLAVIAIMAFGLVLTTILFESLLWVP